MPHDNRPQGHGRWVEKMIYTKIPPNILEALNMWAIRGQRTSGFVEAVLRNDLYGAVAAADAESLAAIAPIMAYVCNRLPSGCWGSRERVDEWPDSDWKFDPLDPDLVWPDGYDLSIFEDQSAL